MRRCLFVVVTLLALTACQADDPDVADGPSSNTSVPTGSSTAAPTTTAPTGSTTVAPVTSAPKGSTTSAPTTAAPPNDTATTASTTVPPDLDIGPPGGPGAASVLVADAKCDPAVIGQAVAVLAWTPAAEAGDGQIVEVTIYGFDPGDSSYSSPLDPRANSLQFTGLSGQAVHSWRVLTLHGDRWTPSDPGSFVGPDCVVDVSP